MPFVAIPGCMKVELLWTFDGTKSLANVLHVGKDPLATSPYTLANLQTVADAVHASVVLNWLPQITTHMRLVGVRATDLSTVSGPQANATGAAADGTDTSNALPSSVAIVVTLRTVVRSRSGRGRIYLAGMSTAAIQTNGHFTAGAIAAATSFIATLRVDINTALPGDQLAVASRAHGNYQLVTLSEVRSPLARSQDRREEDH